MRVQGQETGPNARRKPDKSVCVCVRHVFIFTAVKSSLRELTRAVSALKYDDDDDDDKAKIVFDLVYLFNPLVQFRLH